MFDRALRVLAAHEDYPVDEDRRPRVPLMVHFHADVVGAYLADTHRILKAGGRALFHHSNYAENPDRHFGQNPGARAYMTAAIFRTLADQAGLVILEDQTIDWGGVLALDRVTLLEKT